MSGYNRDSYGHGGSSSSYGGSSYAGGILKRIPAFFNNISFSFFSLSVLLPISLVHSNIFLIYFFVGGYGGSSSSYGGGGSYSGGGGGYSGGGGTKI